MPQKPQPKKKQPVKKKRETKPKQPATLKRVVYDNEWQDLNRRVESLHNDWTGQVVGLGVKVDQHTLGIVALESRLRDIVRTLTALTPVIAELQKFDQYVHDSMKRHEERYHLPFDKDEAIDPARAERVLEEMFPRSGEPNDQH